MALFGAEALAPGAFLLWFGIAAAAMFAITLVVPDIYWVWQAIVFVGLATASTWVYRTWFMRNERPSDRPLLNRRAEQLVGRVVPLETAIVDGRGRVQIGDAFWTVVGEDLPAATRVRVVGVEDGALRVEPAS
ncbi:NfeD family protein [Coralloluteibacterium stylophorae]|uniref:NfeD family protein n=2 Tax=Coralloluteibacterium stylophorae TaxID=1776034 RepID=A0A8J7VY47_9GAMM|nr:NfeD family protein [Coralloluteibacterium stylophorae]MBS7456051.1 NfeD family protein [Coralloluteibacterium stylophorae]